MQIRKLTDIKIHENVSTIGKSAFEDCASLKSFDIPKKLSKIEPNTFFGCDLREVTIPANITSLGNGAFSYNKNLTKVNILSDKITFEGFAIFGGCSSLKEFNGYYTSEDKRCLIDNNVMHDFAPAGVTEYTIPSNVTKIGEWAFIDCNRLEKINLHDKISIIGSYAFLNCSLLSSVIIPEGVVSIDEGAFYGCDLESVYSKSKTPYTLRNLAFGEYDVETVIYVPTASVDSYKVYMGWSNYADNIVGYDF